jgi:hypothetical protein
MNLRSSFHARLKNSGWVSRQIFQDENKIRNAIRFQTNKPKSGNSKSIEKFSKILTCSEKILHPRPFALMQ